jgi:hypothetical protein
MNALNVNYTAHDLIKNLNGSHQDGNCEKKVLECSRLIQKIIMDTGNDSFFLWLISNELLKESMIPEPLETTSP